MTEPDRIGPYVAEMAAKLGLEHPMESAKLFSSWEAIVGPQVAAKCRPTSFRRGVLQVRTSSPAWASEFKYLAPEVMRRINEELGKQVVREIKPWVDTGRERKK